MRIVFVFDGLQIGGIERVGVDYINLLSNRNHNVSVINLSPNLVDMYPQLPSNCKVYEFNFPRKLVPYRYIKLVEFGVLGSIIYPFIYICLNIFNILKKILLKHKFRLLKDSDVVIAFSGHFNDLYFVSSNWLPGKKIAWLHGAEFEYRILSEGFFLLYKKIKNLVCLSELCDITCRNFNKKNSIRKELIYNPILITERIIDQKKVNDLKRVYGDFVLMVGRLAPDKDQKTAILAMNYLNHKRNTKINILFAGDGTNRKDLELFVLQNDAQDYVHFIGNCFDIQNYYSAALIYVHSSPQEGLPTVLLEALSFGLPIASTDSIPGVREILGNNEYGLISPVGDWKALGENINVLLSDEKLRVDLSFKGKQRVKLFSKDIAISKLEKYISGLK
ncbi:glycosyltransferase [Succinivibrio dextrinosolvens]|uniref:glycosyltransferase n=1 Tax=Succinivibrio dextrinosolvens TaxID=83771 RepID=UPI0004E0E225|nr:glycosyltransferase [Succinivibrio dextrinosolvens]